jgi:hypothetical protein
MSSQCFTPELAGLKNWFFWRAAEIRRQGMAEGAISTKRQARYHERSPLGRRAATTISKIRCQCPTEITPT